MKKNHVFTRIFLLAFASALFISGFSMNANAIQPRVLPLIEIASGYTYIQDDKLPEQPALAIKGSEIGTLDVSGAFTSFGTFEFDQLLNAVENALIIGKMCEKNDDDPRVFEYSLSPSGYCTAQYIGANGMVFDFVPGRRGIGGTTIVSNYDERTNTLKNGVVYVGGRVLVPLIYDEIVSTAYRLGDDGDLVLAFIVRNGDKKAVCDENGVLLCETAYSDIVNYYYYPSYNAPRSESVFMLKSEDGNYELLRTDGSILDETFDSYLFEAGSNMFVVKKGDSYSAIHFNGETLATDLSDPTFTDGWDGGFIQCKIDGKKSVITRDGVILETELDIQGGEDGLYYVANPDGLFGVIDRSQTLIRDYIYSDISYHENGYFIGTKAAGGYDLFTKDDVICSAHSIYSYHYPLIIFTESDGQTGVMDFDGTMIIPTGTYSDIQAYGDFETLVFMGGISNEDEMEYDLLSRDGTKLNDTTYCDYEVYNGFLFLAADAPEDSVVFNVEKSAFLNLPHFKVLEDIDDIDLNAKYAYSSDGDDFFAYDLADGQLVYRSYARFYLIEDGAHLYAAIIFEPEDDDGWDHILALVDAKDHKIAMRAFGHFSNPKDGYFVAYDLDDDAGLMSLLKIDTEAADYSELDAALAKIPDDLSRYTADSVEVLDDAVSEVDRTKRSTEQADVDAYTANILAAIDQLVLNHVTPAKPKPVTPSTPTTPPAPTPFRDVPDTHWASKSIAAVTVRGLFKGVGDDTFDPGGTMTRAMFTTVLHRLAGEVPSGTAAFSDVPQGAWYAEAVAWAADIGIVSGTGNGNFAPDSPVTREQMAVMLYNYLLQYDLTLPMSDPAPFADDDQISPWAAEAVAYLRQTGLFTGKDENRFDPQATASRAEVAAIFDRLMERASI